MIDIENSKYICVILTLRTKANNRSIRPGTKWIRKTVRDPPSVWLIIRSIKQNSSTGIFLAQASLVDERSSSGLLSAEEANGERIMGCDEAMEMEV